MSELAITQKKLEATREEIENRLVEFIRKIYIDYPDVWIGYTGTLSKASKDYVNFQIAVNPKTKREMLEQTTKEKEGSLK